MKPDRLNLRDPALPNIVEKKSKPCHLSKKILSVKKPLFKQNLSDAMRKVQLSKSPLNFRTILT